MQFGCHVRWGDGPGASWVLKPSPGFERTQDDDIVELDRERQHRESGKLGIPLVDDYVAAGSSKSNDVRGGQD
jgi:hypothetical protein